MLTRRLTILLTRYPTKLTSFLCFCKGCTYFHASLGFEDDLNVFYSFGFRGFRKETLSYLVERGCEPYRCAMYELDVPEAAYQKAQAIIRWYVLNKRSVRYTRLGVFFAMLNLGCKWQGHSFCSQFVAHVLEKADAATLKKDSCLYLPEDLGRLKEAREVYRGDVLGLARRLDIFAA